MDVSDEELHALTRAIAETLSNPDKKQLRYNDIVRVSRMFYNDPKLGVVELIHACDRDNATLYVAGKPMWSALEKDYAWMLP